MRFGRWEALPVRSLQSPSRMGSELRFGLLVALLVGVAGLQACYLLGDCFFKSHGQVLSCSTSEPLEGVMISLHVDDGFHPGSDLQKAFVTDAQGMFTVDASATEDCGATVTLELRKPGFIDQSIQVHGTKKAALEVCMSPAPAP